MFKGYHVMVTGATSGIGLGIAKEFLAQGAKVMGLGRDFTKIKEDLGPNFIPVKCDVLDPEQIKAACDQIETVFDGKLDVLINNANYEQDNDYLERCLKLYKKLIILKFFLKSSRMN